MFQNRSAALLTAFGDANGAYESLGMCPGGSRSASELAWGRFWTPPGRSWVTRGVTWSALGRHLGVPEAPRACPDASPKRLWAPKTAQDRFFVDFSSIAAPFGWIFSCIFHRLLVCLSFLLLSAMHWRTATKPHDDCARSSKR